MPMFPHGETLPLPLAAADKGYGLVVTTYKRQKSIPQARYSGGVLLLTQTGQLCRQ